MKICVVGDGGWGTANAMLLSGYGHDVTLWGAFPDYIEEMRRTRRNERYLPGVELPAAVRLESDRARAAEGAEVVVLAPPSKYFAKVAEGFRGLVGPEALVVSITKGLCERTCRRMTELGEETLGIGPIVALAGPSHAEEVSRGIPTAVVAACTDPEKARRVQEIWSGPRFRVYTSDDPAGVEIGGAVKNVLAIAVGCSDGMGFGDNTRAALITRGLVEMKRFVIAYGGRRRRPDRDLHLGAFAQPRGRRAPWARRADRGDNRLHADGRRGGLELAGGARNRHAARRRDADLRTRIPRLPLRAPRARRGGARDVP